MRIEQKADGSYQKVLTATEISLMRYLTIEARHREQYDAHLLTLIQRLQLEVESLKNRVRALEVK